MNSELFIIKYQSYNKLSHIERMVPKQLQIKRFILFYAHINTKGTEIENSVRQRTKRKKKNLILSSTM